MKTLILLVLAVIGAQAAVIQSSARSNLTAGSVGVGDRLLYSSYFHRPAIFNTVKSQDVIYRGNITTWITAVQAIEVGATQWASAYVIAGGVGRNNVTVRFQSAVSRGYDYQFSIWGR